MSFSLVSFHNLSITYNSYFFSGRSVKRDQLRNGLYVEKIYVGVQSWPMVGYVNMEESEDGSGSRGILE